MKRRARQVARIAKARTVTQKGHPSASCNHKLLSVIVIYLSELLFAYELSVQESLLANTQIP